MSQTAYNTNMGVSFAGMKADSRFDEVESFAAEVAIPFGRGVSADAGDVDSVKLVTADTEIFRGIALHTHKVPVDGVTRYEIGDTVSVLRKGLVWVETSIAVTADETAYIDVSGAIGKFTNVSTSNLATGGKFRSTVAAAGLALVEINIP